MKNEIAKLLEAHTAFWRDLNSLVRDITYLIKHSYKWVYFESHRIKNNYFYDSFYGDQNKLLFVIFDLTEDIPFLQFAMFHLIDPENDEGKEISINYLEENWRKIDPLTYLFDKNYNLFKTEKGFSIIETENNNEYYTFSPKIDLLSIVSNEIVNTDLNALIKALIDDDNENYCPKTITYTE
jgi:hypothetical protein